MNRHWPVALFCLFTACGARAEIVRIDIQSVSPAEPVPGAVPYEIVRGMAHGELDPRHADNAIITDIGLAARNRRRKVDYAVSFQIARPVDARRTSGVLIYDVPNRGRGEVRADPAGHVRVISGWQGDIVPDGTAQGAIVPIARGRDGASITGAVLARFSNIAANTRSIPISGGIGRATLRPRPVSTDTARASLTRASWGTPGTAIAPDAWAFADCRTQAFPGTPDPAHLCLRDGFDPQAAYTLVYEGKDPLVLGIGFAATRDLVSFLRSGKADRAGSPNPAGPGIRWALGYGISQSGNFLRSFVRLGFNRDLAGRRVFDGINPDIAARQVPLNLRFGLPGGAANLFEAGSEGALWWSPYEDRARGLGTLSLMDRCTQTSTCPKVVETFGSAEFWGLRASAGLIGTDAARDVPLPATVRRYYFPSVSHGGAWGASGFLPQGAPKPDGCVLAGNPNPSAPGLRAARRALIAWVKDGTEPPPSRYPSLSAGDLVEPTSAMMGWPAIPDAPLPDGKINPFYDYDFGPAFVRADVSGVAAQQPPQVRRILPQRVPRVNADGNETAGLPSVYLEVPLGTYTGWNVQADGLGRGGGCGFSGGFIPFARTRADQLATGDPRASLEERYGSHAGFVDEVKQAVARHRQAGRLLPDEADRIIKEAEDSQVLR